MCVCVCLCTCTHSLGAVPAARGWGSAPTSPWLLPGVTAIRPEDLEFPNTMTDIDYDTWMLRLGCLPWGPAGQCRGEGSGVLGLWWPHVRTGPAGAAAPSLQLREALPADSSGSSYSSLGAAP